MDCISLCDGWILSREHRAHASGAELIYWLSTEHGPRCVTLAEQRWRGFVRESDARRWRQWLGQRPGWELTAVPAQDFSHQPVWALDVVAPKLWRQVRQQAQASGWSLLEADIAPQERYLMARFIRNGVTVRAQGHRLLAMRPAQPQHQPSMVSLDIECSRHGELYSIGFYHEGEQSVWMIGPAPAEPAPSYLHFVENEAELLRATLHWFEQHDPDAIIGWSVAHFDLALLHKRAQLYGIRLSLGRDGSEPAWQERAGPGRECSIAGRLVLDGIDWLKAAFYSFDSFALDNVAHALLGEGKACQDSVNRLAEIEHNFHHNKLALAHYNLKDCELVWRIFEKTDLMAFVLARGSNTGLQLDRTGGSSAAFTFRYLPLLHRAGYVAPDLTEHTIPPSPGGYVMDSMPGLYRNVLLLDFKSLYPSIIRSFLIDPMGMIVAERAPEDASVVGFRGARFHREQHRLPGLIAELAEQRELAKRDKNAPLSQAIKILMNSFYGVLGASGCRFHDPKLASSITLRGHEIMKQTRVWIEQQGYRVIYGDTDSVFVHVGDGCEKSQARAIGLALSRKINAAWCDNLAELGLESALELEFETQFDRFFMPTIRGSLVGSKKRYVGAVINDGEIDLIFKGMETVRSDWTAMARQLQQELYHDWFSGRAVLPLLKRWIKAIRSGDVDHLLVYRKRLRQPLDAYQASPPHVQAARLANAMLNKEHYRKGSQISYFIGLSGAYPQKEGKGELDREHYIEKQLKPIAEPVLIALGIGFHEVDGDQLGLF
ncbi:DNA polymerase II [Ferrimonas pelagia]